MRIVIATTTGFHLRHLAVELIAQGHDVTFISYLPRYKTRAYGLPRRATRSLFWRLQPFSALALWRGGGPRTARLRERLLAITDRLIARRMPACDIFIGLSSMAVASARAARAVGASVVVERGSSHVLTQARLVAADGGAPLSDLYIARELASYAAADRIVVPSRFAATSFASEGMPIERVEAVPLGVDLATFTPATATPPLPVSMLFVGQWSHRKGADLLATVLARDPDLRVTHVGSHLDVPFPASPRFRSLGYLNHVALAREMARHHVLVLPSREDGFGMVMTEALAAGLRVVASDATGGPDLARLLPRHLIVFPAGSVDALAAALAQASAAVKADPSGYRPAAAELACLSWREYGKRYAQFLATLTR